MRKIVGLLVFALVLGGCMKKDAMGAIKINTSQPATVQIDGKDVGQAPYSSDQMKAGEISLRLTPQDTTLQPFDTLIDVTAGVWTVVNRTFATNTAQSDGFILTMEPVSQSIASISVVSEPDGAMVKMDGNAIGPTPLEKGQVDEGSHSLVISAPGYKELTVPVSSKNGYKVIVNAKLSKMEVAPIQDIEASESAESTSSARPSGSPTPSKTTTPTPSKAVSGTPTPSKAVSPTPTKAAGTSSGKQVKILSTPTGWLRVRAEASVNSEEVGKVNPGETYDLLDEDSGWYKIKLENGKEGWVAGQYADKI